MRTEEQRKNEMISYFDEKVFNPAIEKGRELKNSHIIQGVKLTRMRMMRLPSDKMLGYFWSAIHGTDKSISFSKIMKKYGIVRFEDILEEVREKFNDDFFKN